MIALRNFDVKILQHALVLESLYGAVTNGHGCIKLIKAEDDVDMVGEDRRRCLAVRLGVARVASRVAGGKMKNG